MLEESQTIISSFYEKYRYDNTLNTETIMKLDIDAIGGGNCIGLSLNIQKSLKKFDENAFVIFYTKNQIKCVPCKKYATGLGSGFNHLVVLVKEKDHALILESSSSTAYPFIIQSGKNEQTDTNLNGFSWNLDDDIVSIYRTDSNMKKKLACECFINEDLNKHIETILVNVEKMETRLVTKRQKDGIASVAFILNKKDKKYTLILKTNVIDGKSQKFTGVFSEMFEKKLLDLLGLDEKQKYLLIERIKNL